MVSTRLQRLFPYLLITPALVFVGAVILIPTLYSFWLSLHENRRADLVYVGLENFQNILTNANFWTGLARTLIYGGLYVGLVIVFGFALALIFKSRPKGSAFFLTLIFIPWMLSEIVAGIMWRWMFLPNIGVLQNVLGPLLGDYSFLGEAIGAMSVVVAATVWRGVAFALLLLLAGLQTVPAELGEAASIDGANRWQRFWRITYPLMLPTTQVTVVFLSIQAINAVGMFLSITDGGPGRATDVISLQMYKQALQFNNFGYASAVSVLMFFVNAALALVYINGMRAQNALD
ncbi:MAG: sugar ABC transporter permease [bacterium]|nr:sugar ABC transporter permease [bacterium]